MFIKRKCVFVLKLLSILISFPLESKLYSLKINFLIAVDPFGCTEIGAFIQSMVFVVFCTAVPTNHTIVRLGTDY